MASFCVQCGAPLSGAFCVKCGADALAATNPSPGQAPTPDAEQIRATLGSPALPTKKMSPLAKLAIAAVVIIFVGGVAAALGVYYIAHRVSQKIHQASEGILGSSSDSTATGTASTSGNSSAADSADSSLGDVCRFLSKEDVSKAIGVEIVRTQSEDSGCSYIAKGDQADMTAKHATAIAASRGADKKTQQVFQQFAGGMFKEFQGERPPSEQDKSGEVMVFNFSVDENAAEEQMRLNAKGLSVLGDMQGLPGIGDQAFVSADGLIMVRKANKLIRIMYLTCPCGTEQVKPLARKIAAAL